MRLPFYISLAEVLPVTDTRATTKLNAHMESPTNDYGSFAAGLGLETQVGELFVGTIDGFPVGLKIIGYSNLLLFQVRHWCSENDSRLKCITYSPEIANEIADKKLQIEFDERIAWLTYNSDSHEIKTTEVRAILNSILAAFKSAELIGDPSVCHYCQKTTVDGVSVIEDKVAQICEGCLEERYRKKEREIPEASAEAVPILLMSPWAAGVGAVLWATFWMGSTLLLDLANTNTILVPRLVVAIVVGLLGVLVGGPVGWIIKQNKRRGAKAAATAAIVFGITAVIAGEILYTSWLLYHVADVFSLSAAVRILPKLYLADDPFFLAFRIGAAAAAVFTAYQIAKPPKAILKI